MQDRFARLSTWALETVARGLVVALLTLLVAVAVLVVIGLLVGPPPPPPGTGDSGGGLLNLYVAVPVVLLATIAIVGYLGWLWYAAVPQHANRTSYDYLKVHLDALEVLFSGKSSADWIKELGQEQKMVIEQAETHFQAVQSAVKDGRALRWITGHGYIDAWSTVRRAETLLIACLPLDLVIEGALNDEQSLIGSEMSNKEHFLHQLRQAVAVLSPAGAEYLEKKPNPMPTSGAESTEARSALQEVHRSIDLYRGSRWEGLVRLANRTVATAVITSVLTAALLIAVVVAGAGDKAIMAGAIFYLIGAVAGLLHRLYQESAIETAVEDYGVTTARVLTTPVLSGLAAVGGVLVVAVGGANMAVDAAGFDLTKVYWLQPSPVSIVLAAAFGVTPSLLFGQLQGAGEKLKEQLKTSRPADGAAK